jgi:RHS repeat-associated protein
MINFEFNPLADNRVPGLTPGNATTGWIINGRGEASTLATQVGGSTNLGLTWDGMGSLVRVAGNGCDQTYTYGSDGLRLRTVDALNSANNRKYVYGVGGGLLSEFGDAGWKRDVVYLGAMAIAEIDASGVHELHSDLQGTPRVVTRGATGAVEGRQTFGPYGESMPALCSGYVPLTGYTGHIQTEANGLIYMKGRFYSPAWHRFLHSDQGVDASSMNQFAYCGGSPFMAVDPSGLIQVAHDGGHGTRLSDADTSVAMVYFAAPDWVMGINTTYSTVDGYDGTTIVSHAPQETAYGGVSGNLLAGTKYEKMTLDLGSFPSSSEAAPATNSRYSGTSSFLQMAISSISFGLVPQTDQPALSVSQVKAQYTNSYRYWQNHLEDLGYGQFRLPGIISNDLRAYGIDPNAPECMEYAEAAAGWLNDHVTIPGAQATAVPNSNYTHYTVQVTMNGGATPVTSFAPWMWNWAH